MDLDIRPEDIPGVPEKNKDEKIVVLYVDDEMNNLNAFKATFRRQFKVLIANSAEEGLKIVKEQEDLHVIVTDQRMPEVTGIEFLEQVLEIRPDPIRMLLTGYADIKAVIDAINKGRVYRYITKPWDEEELKMTIEKAYEVFDLRRENKELTKRLIRANEQLEFLLRQRLLDDTSDVEGKEGKPDDAYKN